MILIITNRKINLIASFREVKHVLNMFFGIKREISCFSIWHESAEFRSFAPNECNARPFAWKKWKIFSDA